MTPDTKLVDSDTKLVDSDTKLVDSGRKLLWIKHSRQPAFAKPFLVEISHEMPSQQFKSQTRIKHHLQQGSLYETNPNNANTYKGNPSELSLTF